MEKVTILIDGMSCQHCVMRVKKSIEALPGVSGLEVEVGKAIVTFDAAKVGKADIEAAVGKAGYKIRS